MEILSNNMRERSQNLKREVRRASMMRTSSTKSHQTRRVPLPFVAVLFKYCFSLVFGVAKDWRQTLGAKDRLTPQEQLISDLRTEIEDLKEKEEILASRIETQRIENSALQTQLSRLQTRAAENSNPQSSRLAKDVQLYKQQIDNLVKILGLR